MKLRKVKKNTKREAKVQKGTAKINSDSWD